MNNKRLYREKSVEYGLLALVVIGMLFSNVGCTNTELVDGVSKSISVMVSPTGQYLFYGAEPTGNELFAFVQQNGSKVWMYSGKTTAERTVSMTFDLAKAGWRVIEWSKVPGNVQLTILTKLNEIAPLAENVSSNLVNSPVMGMFLIPTFILDGTAKLPNGCKLDNGIMVCNVDL